MLLGTLHVCCVITPITALTGQLRAKPIQRFRQHSQTHIQFLEHRQKYGHVISKSSSNTVCL